MASAVWPAGLPQAPQLRSLREQPADLTVRTAMAVGPAKVRRRQTAGVRIFACELLLTRTQVETLDDFFYETIAAGALPFTWVHHRTGQTVDYRFTGPPEYVPLAPRQAGSEMWRTTFTLEALPGTLVTGDPPDPPPDGGGGGGGAESLTFVGGGGGGEESPAAGLLEGFYHEAEPPDPEIFLEVLFAHGELTTVGGSGGASGRESNIGDLILTGGGVAAGGGDTDPGGSVEGGGSGGV